MNEHLLRLNTGTAGLVPAPAAFLQRKCACGRSAGLSGDCAMCQSKQLVGKSLQRKLRIGAPGDEYEREAHRVAAIMWDSPADEITATNVGKSFQTCAVCEDRARVKKVLACLFWGYFIDGSGKVNFTPPVPTAECGPTQQLKDADTRWRAIEGNKPSNITF